MKKEKATCFHCKESTVVDISQDVISYFALCPKCDEDIQFVSKGDEGSAYITAFKTTDGKTVGRVK